jgi:hypothetical protein
MKVSREYPKGQDFDALWLDRSEKEEVQRVFLANQEGSFALLSMDGLKGWAKEIVTDHENFPEDVPLDMSGAFSSLIMNKPGTPDWVPVTPEVRLHSRELLLRYTVNGDRVCDSFLLEG